MNNLKPHISLSLKEPSIQFEVNPKENFNQISLYYSANTNKKNGTP